MDEIASRTPRVTVLMPVFNAGPLLQDAVDSILGQSFADFELLLIDDGSTDGCIQDLRTHSDPRVRLVSNPRNLGLVATLNRGLAIARAPLLARMDADDIALRPRLERQVEAMDRHSEVALIGSWARFIDEEGRPSDLCQTPQDHASIRQAILVHNTFIHPSVMMRTEVVRAIGGYPADAEHAEDYALWLLLLEHHQAINLPECLLLYRIHPGQVSQKKMALQRRNAGRLRTEARARRLAIEPATTFPSLAQPSLWRRLTAGSGTLGADYLDWVRRYQRLGKPADALAASLAALRVAPLSRTLLLAVAKAALTGRLWTLLFNFRRGR